MTAAEISRRLAGVPFTIPAMRGMRRVWSREIARWTPAEVLRLAEQLAGLGSGERFVGYELVAYHPGAMASLGASSLTRLGRGLADWGSVDTFACYLAGPAWRNGLIPTALIHRWTKSPDRWRRRTALVSTVPLNLAARGGSGDPARTLDICRRLAADRDDMVVKALSWALRSLIPRDRDAVEGFLARHQAVLAPRVLREVRTKLRTGRKSPRP